jgi:chemotaxis protein histidine kinase CheA
MLKKSDNKEPIKDDMMDLLNQMADDEAASVNAGVTGIDEDDGGVPLPEVAKYRPAKKADEDIEVIDESAPKKKKEKQKKTSARKQKKESRKKKKDAAEEEIEELLEEADAEDEAKEKKPKKPSKVGKFFNMMTEDLVPEPTEEELQAEKDAKEAKKKENLTKKEEEKAAKAEAKKAQAEQKEADKKAKAEEAAKKKKEKQAAKEAKAQAKREKQAAEKPKKRIPPKNKAAAAAFGIAVGGAVLVSTNILAKQGFLQTARAAYYNQDYKTVYQSTYGMELDENETDGIIKARSEVILKMQRRYDSYQTNLKMGREIEALDALLQGIATYDYINADAEQYGVMDEVDGIKDDILNILDTKYGLSEAEARELINNDDALSYTLELNNIVNNVR